MSADTEQMNLILMPEFKEACWPMKMIWERIDHAYTSDSPPKSWGLQKGDCGFQYWFFSSHLESYSVFWDSSHSYWKIKTPFGPCLFFIGPLFFNKSGKELDAKTLLLITATDTDFIFPTTPSKVKKKMKKIARFVAGKDHKIV